MKKDNVFVNAGIWYILSDFFVKGITLISIPIFTKIMNIEDIGIFSNLTSWINILCIITTFSLFSSVVLAKYDFKDDLNSFISSNLMLSSIIALIVYIFVLIFPAFFEKLFLVDRNVLNIIFVYLIFYSAIEMFHTKCRIEYKYKTSSLINVFINLIAMVASILCTVLYKKNPLNGRLYGFYVVMLICSILIYLYLMIKGKNIKIKYWKYALKYSFPIVIHSLSINVLEFSDRIIINKILGNKATALYTIAYTSAMFVLVLLISMNNAYAPWSYDKMNEKKYDELLKKSKPYFIFFVIISYLYTLVAPEMLYFMGGKEYMEAVLVIPPVIVSYIFEFVYLLYSNIEIFNKKQKEIAFGTIIVGVVNVILNFIFIPKFGYIVSAYTTLVSYIILLIYNYINVKKIDSNYYDFKFFVKSLFLSLLSIPILNILYTFNYFRYIILMIIGICLFGILVKMRHAIISFIKNKEYKKLLNNK